MKKTIIFLTLFGMMNVPAYSFTLPFLNENNTFQEVWKNIGTMADKGVQMALDPKRNEPGILQSLLGQDSKYGKVLKEAREILSKNEATAGFEQIDRLQAKNRELKEKIVELKKKRIAAPTESLNPFTLTKKSIDELVTKKIPAEMAENRQEMERLKKEVLTELQKSGVSIQPEQLDYFLVSAEGTELIKLMSMAGNMKIMQKAIEEQLASDKSNVELAREYAGIHLVCLDAYASAHEAAIENLYEYQKRLNPIIEDAQRMRIQAQKLMAQADKNERKNLESNIRLSMQTISVANAYAKILDRRIKNIHQSKKMVDHKANIARNTYGTIKNGGMLIDVINKSSNDYDYVMNFSMPELKSLYEPVMMDAFSEISNKIRDKI